VAVVEQLGYALVPGPIVDGVLAHPTVNDAVVAIEERPRPYEPLVIAHLDDIDALCLLDDAGVWRVDPADVERSASSWPLDPLTPVARAELLPEGVQVGDVELAHAWRRDGAVYTAAFLVGMAQHLTDISVAYAKEREQFDRPIGSFQAVKHLL